MQCRLDVSDENTNRMVVEKCKAMLHRQIVMAFKFDFAVNEGVGNRHDTDHSDASGYARDRQEDGPVCIELQPQASDVTCSRIENIAVTQQLLLAKV